MFSLVLFGFMNAIVVAFGASCGAQRAADYGANCPTPLMAHLPHGCAVTPAQRKAILGYYDRTSLHHRSQLRYAFPHDGESSTILVIFLDKPVSGAQDSFEVLNTQSAQSENLVYERCGNLAHPGAPFGI